MLRSVLPLTLVSTFALALSFAVVHPGVAAAKEFNFEKHVAKKGCASIVFSKKRSECHRRHITMNTSCRRRLVCDYRKAERVARDYKDKMSKLGAGKKSNRKREAILVRLRSQLETMKAVGSRGVLLATACVSDRAKMKAAFKRVIPLTTAAGRNAKRGHDRLLHLLRVAKRKRYEAKRNKDRAARDMRKWEDAKKNVRKVEQELARFDRANGKNIQLNVGRLVRNYEGDRKRHEQPERDDRSRLDNCTRLSRLSY